MYVSPHYRNRGLARAVLSELETTARAAGQQMILETGLPQPEALACIGRAATRMSRRSATTRAPRFRCRWASSCSSRCPNLLVGGQRIVIRWRSAVRPRCRC